MKSIVTKAALSLIVLMGLSPRTVSTAATLFATDTHTDVLLNNLHSLSLTNGSATLVGPLNVPPIMAGLAYDAVRGILYGTTTATNKLYSIDTTTGAATLIGSLGVDLMHGLAFDNMTGSLYGAYDDVDVSKLYRINTSTGAASFVKNISSINDSHVLGLAFQPGASILYGCLNGPAAAGGLLKINMATGAVTLVAPMQRMSGLAFHPVTGVLYGIDNLGDDRLYSIDVDSGAATLIGYTGLKNNLGLEFAGYRIPEPSGLGMALIATVLGTVRRGRTMLAWLGQS